MKGRGTRYTGHESAGTELLLLPPKETRWGMRVMKMKTEDDGHELTLSRISQNMLCTPACEPIRIEAAESLAAGAHAGPIPACSSCRQCSEPRPHTLYSCPWTAPTPTPSHQLSSAQVVSRALVARGGTGTSNVGGRTKSAAAPGSGTPCAHGRKRRSDGQRYNLDLE